MRSAIDAAGRVVIPKEMRERLGLRRGRPIEIRKRDGRIEIEPATTSMSLVRRSGGSVAVPDEKLPPLTDEIVRDTLERTRRWSRSTPAWSWPPSHPGRRRLPPQPPL